MNTKGLWIEENRLRGPDGVVRELYTSELAGIALFETFNPGVDVNDHLEEVLRQDCAKRIV